MSNNNFVCLYIKTFRGWSFQGFYKYRAYAMKTTRLLEANGKEVKLVQFCYDGEYTFYRTSERNNRYSMKRHFIYKLLQTSAIVSAISVVSLQAILFARFSEKHNISREFQFQNQNYVLLRQMWIGVAVFGISTLIGGHYFGSNRRIDN
ncbi:hypothetical protein [Anabaena azotica]|uniref:Uncharacterized protein n=1 Tax=Anabaena azotica FACHB-119 TaxID=947527 RepID=A0ABR8DAE6_9NOST|nr:hypothetical protein [Anabaena azotica]MBD2503911.1 hypothetical protein [Anabaena azotica FACHB-119]